MMHECQKSCWNLRKAVIGNTVKRIGASEFANDNALTELTIGNSVETIEGSAFWEIAVSKMVFPASLKNATAESFYCMWNTTDLLFRIMGDFRALTVFYTQMMGKHYLLIHLSAQESI